MKVTLTNSQAWLIIEALEYAKNDDFGKNDPFNKMYDRIISKIRKEAK